MISRSICAGEKRPHVDTKVTKSAQQRNSDIRGQRFKTTATAAAKPVHASAVIIALLVSSQKRLGAHRRARANSGNISRICPSVLASGRTPEAPTNARPSMMMPPKTSR
jgi:hypothetical protein